MDNFSNPFLLHLLKINQNLAALSICDKQYSYYDLLHKTKESINIINDIKQGSVIAIIGDFSLDCISMILAGLNNNLVIAPLMDNNEVDSKLEAGEIDYVYKNNKITKLENKKSKNTLFNKLDNNAGLLIFSSGSTGKPKAILHNLNIYLKQYLNKRQKPINSLAMLMFDHIGGLNTMFSCLSMGANLIIPQNRKNPYEIASLIEKYKISLLPTNPTMLNLLLISGATKQFNLNSLRLITYGTESMNPSLLNRLKKEFINTRFKQSFGTSEIGIAKSSGELLINILDMDYKIIDNELFIKSKTQSLGYLNASNAAFGEDGYFATGDLVEIINKDDKQYIKIIGRKKELINVGGEKVFPNEVENIILEIPFIQDCICYGEKNNITNQSVVVKVATKSNLSNLELKKEIRKYCKNKLANYKIPTKIIKVDSILTTNRLKKDRYGGGGQATKPTKIIKT